jgi:hypothetical protein
MNVQAVFNSITKKPQTNIIFCYVVAIIKLRDTPRAVIYIFSYMYRRAPHLPARLLRVHRGEAVVGAVLPGIRFIIYIFHTKLIGTFVKTRL